MKRIAPLSVILIITMIALPRSSHAQDPSGQPTPGRARQASKETADRYLVQIGSSYSTEQKANQAVAQLRRKYPSAHVQSPNGNESIYRVHIGPYNSREEAQQIASELTSAGFRAVMILPDGEKIRSEGDQPVQPRESDGDALRRELASLSIQIGALAEELRMMRNDTQRNSAVMELLLNEDRLAKLEDKIQEAGDHKAQLDAREQEITRRQRNIQGELMLRGGLRRDETETAIRNELQRALDDNRVQQSTNQQRLNELNEQAIRLRARVETSRKKLEMIDLKNEKEEK